MNVGYFLCSRSIFKSIRNPLQSEGQIPGNKSDAISGNKPQSWEKMSTGAEDS